MKTLQITQADEGGYVVKSDNRDEKQTMGVWRPIGDRIRVFPSLGTLFVHLQKVFSEVSHADDPNREG